MKTVFFFIYKDMELLDFAGPYEIFSVANELRISPLFNLKVLSPSGQSIQTTNGVGIEVDASWHYSMNANISIIPGGEGSREVVMQKDLMKLLKLRVRKSEKVASICSGARVLAHLSELDESDFCTHYSVAEEILSLTKNAHYRSDLRYVNAGKIATSAGVTAGMDLALDLVEEFGDQQLRFAIEKYISYSQKKLM